MKYFHFVIFMLTHSNLYQNTSSSSLFRDAALGDNVRMRLRVDQMGVVL